MFADDEKSLQELMRLELPRMGHEVTVCPDGTTAIAALEKNTYDCLLVDLNMPGHDGIEVIAKAKELSPEADSIVLTGKSSLETAVAALRHGAFDYLTKPCKLVELESVLNRVAEKRELTNKYRALKQRLERIEGSSELIGESPGMERVKKLIAKVAPTDSTVLILGDTGTGKELVARALHDQSLRADMPFVPINCGALPENLIESELFGHRKGAFTGADDHRTGLFEVAGGGTLFLDEIGELPKFLQVKILRVLQDSEIRRVGDTKTHKVDVRIIAATVKDLAREVSKGTFREDLYYRLNVIPIHLPPLRERREDIPLLVQHFIKKCNDHLETKIQGIASEAIGALMDYAWMGNVRELENTIERAMVLSDTDHIRIEQLPDRVLEGNHTGSPDLGGKALSIKRAAKEMERDLICKALEKTKGNRTHAARLLEISHRTLLYKIEEYGVQL